MWVHLCVHVHECVYVCMCAKNKAVCACVGASVCVDMCACMCVTILSCLSFMMIIVEMTPSIIQREKLRLGERKELFLRTHNGKESGSNSELCTFSPRTGCNPWSESSSGHLSIV